jgi:hypothetical protein
MVPIHRPGGFQPVHEPYRAGIRHTLSLCAKFFLFPAF